MHYISWILNNKLMIVSYITPVLNYIWQKISVRQHDAFWQASCSTGERNGRQIIPRNYINVLRKFAHVIFQQTGEWSTSFRTLAKQNYFLK